MLLRRQVFQRLLSVLPNHVDRALNRLRRQVVVEEPDRVRDFVEGLAIIVAPKFHLAVEVVGEIRRVLAELGLNVVARNSLSEP